ncbi:MAG: DegT/DnrJ/EryC1/StrS family aminotransferase [Deltaproteobacteria bacterium]|nr:DegT/DnrJ/EryC1/StrS family aminotransferase [Deltaproteobacteria bacterium]
MNTQEHTELGKRIAGARPLFEEEDMIAMMSRIEHILRSGRLILGENTQNFEETFRRYIGTEHAVAVNSCTTALQIVLRFFPVRDREVIVPTNTFVSVIKAILYEGGIPILVDMSPETFCLDTEDVLRRINFRTAGIIAVHIAGLIYPDTDQLYEVCQKKGLFLLEDVSHAHGAMIDQRKGGALADAGCFSFYPTKVMTTGTGGMITTNNARLAAYARSVRHHGQGESLEQVINFGNDWCMGELNAVLGIYQLQRLEANVGRRNQVAAWYKMELAGLDWVKIPQYPEAFRHAYYKFLVLLDEKISKKKLRHILLDRFQIEIGSLYDPPCHLQPVLQKHLGCHEGMFPKAERTLRQQICLPLHAAITRTEVERVVGALKQIIDQCRGE